MDEKELYQCSECGKMIIDNGEFYLCIGCGLTINYPLIAGYYLKSRDIEYENEGKREEARTLDKRI